MHASFAILALLVAVAAAVDVESIYSQYGKSITIPGTAKVVNRVDGDGKKSTWTKCEGGKPAKCEKWIEPSGSVQKVGTKVEFGAKDTKIVNLGETDYHAVYTLAGAKKSYEVLIHTIFALLAVVVVVALAAEEQPQYIVTEYGATITLPGPAKVVNRDAREGEASWTKCEGGKPTKCGKWILANGSEIKVNTKVVFGAKETKVTNLDESDYHATYTLDKQKEEYFIDFPLN